MSASMLLEPTWNIFENFQTTGVPLALKRDATDGVQSVHVEVNHPDEINTLFDPAIVYAKEAVSCICFAAGWVMRPCQRFKRLLC